jgi:hypothetical protein
MVSFRLLLTQKKFYVYREKGGTFEQEYIDGNPWMEYDSHQIVENLRQLLTALKNNHNLDVEEQLQINLIGCADDIRNQQVKKCLEDQMGEYTPLLALLPKIMRALSEDTTLHIAQFGINYDGMSYVMRDGTLEQNDFQLLAYTVSVDQLMEHTG